MLNLHFQLQGSLRGFSIIVVSDCFTVVIVKSNLNHVKIKSLLVLGYSQNIFSQYLNTVQLTTITCDTVILN